MFKVGLTGGIGSGKSTVSDLFKQHNIPVIDADEISHALVTPNSIPLTQIKHCFGHTSITPDGYLNRAQLRKIIFNNPEKKQQLEAIMHPLIFAEINQQLSRLQSAYVIIAVPLLIETQQQSLVDHILVIDCPIENQINRVELRDSLSRTEIIAIINTQVSRKTRLAQANSIIHNTQDIHFLKQQVNQLHKLFLKKSDHRLYQL